MAETLEDILNGTEETATEATEGNLEATEAESTDEPQETGEQAETEPEKAEPEESTPDSKEEPWTKAAVMDERRKRQALERELAELRKPKEEQKRPDVFDDPDGAFSHVQNQIKQDIVSDRISMSRDFMQMLKDDYDEMEKVFVDMASDNPALAQEMLSHPNPARYAYEQAVKHREYQQMQDVDGYKAKLREEVKAELLKEMQEEQAKEAQKEEAVTPSLAKQRSSGNKDPSPGDESLEDILGR